MNRYRLSDLAKEELINIWMYIAQDNPTAADQQLDTLHKKFQLLADNPGIGRRRQEFSSDNLHSFPHDSYVIFYEPREKKSIEISRVLHETRNIETLLE